MILRKVTLRQGLFKLRGLVGGPSLAMSVAPWVPRVTSARRRTVVVIAFALASQIALTSPHRAEAAAGSVIPRTDKARIAARFGSTIVPGWIPAGYRYISWKDSPGSVAAYGTNLEVGFAKRGLLLEWTVNDGRDQNSYAYIACTPHPAIDASFGDRILFVGKTRVVFQKGNKGATASMCLTRDLQTRFTDPMWSGTGVTVWTDNSALLTVQQLAKILGSAATLSS